MPKEKTARNWFELSRAVSAIVMAGIQAIFALLGSVAIDEFRGLHQSINALNSNVAVLITDGKNKESEISDLKQRISDLERRRKYGRSSTVDVGSPGG